MKKSLIKPVVATLLIITLTMANFVLLGANLCVYAADILSEGTKTNNSNVTFDAYFKNSNGETVSTYKESVSNSSIKLYMQVSVKNEGYLHSTISLGDSNFKIKDNILSSAINKIEGNTITLNQINAGQTVEIEVEVEPIKDNAITTQFLSMSSNISINGTYKNSSQKDVQIDATRQVQLVLTSPYAENEGLELTSEILTNKIFEVNGENKRIVQILVKSGLVNNEYPIKATNLSLNVPEGVEEVTVISRGTLATNGKSENDFNEANWAYLKDDKTINVTILNNEESGKISWLKSGRDQIVVTYIMSEDANIDNTELSIKDEVTLYDTEGTVKLASTTNTVLEEKDGIITNEVIVSENSMYKGKIYSGEGRTYSTTANIYVNSNKTGAEVNTDLGIATYETSEKSLEANSQYVKTVINKANLIKILGENGELKILNADGLQLASITNETEADENGNIVINYPENIKALKIQTTKVQNAGTIALNNTKVIKQETYGRSTLETVISLKEVITGAETNVELKNTTTAATLEVNKTSLSTITENTGVEMRATLKTNSEENDLYKNPKVKIVLPSQVESININSANLIYEDELQIKSTNVYEENGNKVIEIDILGEQTKHKEGTIEEATIIINANITVNKKATSSDETLKMTVTNELSGIAANVEKELKIVSPRGLVTVNSINDYNMTVIGEEETKTAKLELGAEAKQTTVNIEVINNNESAINDVKILGDYPTKNTNNTMQTTVSEIQNLSVEATVYYTQNENATADLENNENGWTTEFTDGTLVKKYLIVVQSMEIAGEISASYTLSIPEGLGYNEQAYEGYKVVYTESLSGTTSEIAATTLGLSTGKGPELTAKLTATVGSQELSDGDKVSTGEVVKYTLELENTGTENATDVQITGDIPEGTTQVEKNTTEDEESSMYKTIEATEYTTSVESIAIGEKATVEYEVQLTKEAEESEEISNEMIAAYNDLEVKTEVVTFDVESSDVVVQVGNSKYLISDAIFTPGDPIDYYAEITNLSDETLKNVKLDWILPDNVSIYYQERVYNFGEDNETLDQLEANKSIILPEIEANSTATIHLVVILSDSVSSIDSIPISAVVTVNGQSTTSNEVNTNVYSVDNAKIELSSTNENGYLVDGDTVEYKIVATNNNEISIAALVRDQIPSELTVLSVKVNGEEQSIEEIEDNTVEVSLDIDKGASTEVIITALVNYDETRTEATTITNKAELIIGSEITKTSEEVSHILIASSENITNVKNMISGTVWFDENQDGKRDSNEELLEGIKVRLINVATGEIAKDSEENELITTTNSKGLYIFSQVPQGDYIVVFEYDTSTYVVTAYQKAGVPETNNSDAITKTLTIDGQEGTYGVTDTITMNESGISNIDLGLISSTVFDLELHKYVSRIIVQNSKGTSTYEFDNATLAKVEIAAKNLQGSTVVIEYKIDVTNTGELEGYVKSVADYMPSELKFSSELNKDWYQSGSDLYNTSLANTKIAAGETKTLTLTLTKTMTEENTGRVNNTAEIAESYNESGLQDIDSIAGNKVQGEDDMGSADVIIGVKTGAMITYIGLTISIIALIAVGAYFVSRKIAKANEIKVNL